MRHMLVVLGLGTLLVVVGCTSLQGHRPVGDIRPPTSSAQPSSAALVDYLNKNASAVQTIDCGELRLNCKMGKQEVGLHGWLVCQKPRNFRMAAKVMGNDAADMGSNSQEFWYWISKAEPPYQFHCTYEDLTRGNAAMPFPFQPDWIVQALGVAHYGPPEGFQVVPNGNTWELVEQTTGPQGQPIRKVTVFNRGAATGNAPQVSAHLLQDGNGRLICAAYISEVQQDRTSGAVIPRRLRLVYPKDEIELKLELNEVSVNGPMNEKRTAALFSRPRYENIQSYDLGKRVVDNRNGGIQRAAGMR